MKEFSLDMMKPRKETPKSVSSSTIPEDHVFDFRNPKPPTLVEPTLDPQSGLVPYWSASLLKKFEKCPYSVFLRYVKRILEPSNEAMERGTKIHQMAEDFVQGITDELPKELIKFERDFIELKEQYEEDITKERYVLIEDDWAYRSDWSQTDWKAKDVWLRMKLDVFIRENLTSAKIIDHKTGRKFGNELSHSEQAMIYAIGAFVRYPELEYIECEFWYLDHGEKLFKIFRRFEFETFLKRIEQRALVLTTCNEFLPKPSKSACKWCHYLKTGDCEYGSLT